MLFLDYFLHKIFNMKNSFPPSSYLPGRSQSEQSAVIH